MLREAGEDHQDREEERQDIFAIFEASRGLRD
jgi:hypothetical protein